MTSCKSGSDGEDHSAPRRITRELAAQAKDDHPESDMSLRSAEADGNVPPDRNPPCLILQRNKIINVSLSAPGARTVDYHRADLGFHRC